MSERSRSLGERIASFYASDVRLSLKIIASSLAFGVLGAIPLLLYVAFGPIDGSPVGLGMLAMGSVLLAQLGLMAGLVRLSWELFTGTA